MKYQELRKDAETVAHTSKIEVLELDGTAYKLFDKSFSPTQVFYEAMLQTLAEEAGIRVPKIYGIERIDDRFAILSEYIVAGPLNSLWRKSPVRRTIISEFWRIRSLAYTRTPWQTSRS